MSETFGFVEFLTGRDCYMQQHPAAAAAAALAIMFLRELSFKRVTVTHL